MKTATLVTWNVEWRPATSAAGRTLRDRIFAHRPDIICLTEAPADFLGETGHVIEAQADYGYPIVGNRRKVQLWSRQPWQFSDNVGHAGLPSGRFVSGTTETPIGALSFFGVCIPWSAAHVSTGRHDRRRWEDHFRYLEGLRTILQARDRRTVILGDFNQAIPRRTAPLAAYDALEQAVSARFAVATEGLVDATGCHAIDHVAHSRDLAAQSVLELSRFDPSGNALSDHFGVVVRLGSA